MHITKVVNLSKSPATNSIVKTVAGALGVNVKHSERLQAKRQGHSQVPVSHLDLSSSEVVTDIGKTDGFNGDRVVTENL